MEEVVANLRDAIEGWFGDANSHNAIKATDRIVEIAV
jgi:predicted RNase H-like HicB family nuclease